MNDVYNLFHLLFNYICIQKEEKENPLEFEIQFEIRSKCDLCCAILGVYVIFVMQLLLTPFAVASCRISLQFIQHHAYIFIFQLGIFP